MRILMILAAAVSLIAAAPAPDPAPAETYLKAGRFFDGNAAPRRDVVIHVRDGRIVEVGAVTIPRARK